MPFAAKHIIPSATLAEDSCESALPATVEQVRIRSNYLVHSMSIERRMRALFQWTIVNSVVFVWITLFRHRIAAVPDAGADSTA